MPSKKSASKKSSRKSARPRRPQTRAVCTVEPEPGPFTFPAGGGEFIIYVYYPTPPNPCPYTAKSNKKWMTTTPRIMEFDVTLTQNRSSSARRGVVTVQGQGNPIKHKVTIHQHGH